MRDEVDFLPADKRERFLQVASITLHTDKHQSFLEVDFNTFEIKFSYKLIPSSLMISISLQYLKKEVRDGAHFLHVDKHQSFLQVDFNILEIKVSYKMMGIIRHSQSTQSNMFAIS